MVPTLNEKASKVIQLAKQRLGYPYVYAGAGQACTPANRRAKKNSGYPNIVNKCPVLNGNATQCTGCKYNGTQFFDCRGFTYWLFKQVGVSISAVGATTQYNTASSWLQRGKISQMPNVVCSVFKYKADSQTMNHTGLHIGNGVIIHCTGVKSGQVQFDSVSNTTWTHYGIPKGLYTEEQVNSAGKVTLYTTLRSGMSGSAVTEMQNSLNNLGFKCVISGKYDTATIQAVKEFQIKYQLTVDGVAGPITRTLILYLAGDQVIEETNNDTVTLTLDRETAKVLYNILKNVLT